MENKAVGIEYKTKIWCELGCEEEVTKLFALMDELLEEEEGKEKERLEKAFKHLEEEEALEEEKAEEKETLDVDLAEWKAMMDTANALLEVLGLSDAYVRVECYELVTDDEYVDDDDEL